MKFNFSSRRRHTRLQGDWSSDVCSSDLLAGRDPRIKLVNLSRRFGKIEGVLAAMEYARGDAIVMMDTDLQDPPEVIPEMIQIGRASCRVRGQTSRDSK